MCTSINLLNRTDRYRPENRLKAAHVRCRWYSSGSESAALRSHFPPFSTTSWATRHRRTV